MKPQHVPAKAFAVFALVLFWIIMSWWYSFRRSNHGIVDLVIARYNESLDWLESGDIGLSTIRTVWIYNKGNTPIRVNIPNAVVINLPNTGRCDGTYLHHIVEHYETGLADVTVFLPGSSSMSTKWEKALATIGFAKYCKESVFVNAVKTIKGVRDTLYSFSLNEWTSSSHENKVANLESRLFPAPVRPFGKWVDTYLGPERAKCKYHVYLGIFAVSKEHIRSCPKTLYQELLRQMNMHSNPEAGHYLERAWMALFHPISKTNLYSL